MAPPARPEVAIVHDYLTQRGGAERVVLSLCRAFPDAPVYTSIYAPKSTFPEFAALDVRTTWLDRVPALKSRHRAAFPLLARAFDELRVDARVTIASSSGWAHAVRTTGAKLVYCHTPARWLYYPAGYLRRRQAPHRAVLAFARGRLITWDKRAAGTADTYIANSNLVAQRIWETYGVEAQVVPPPPALCHDGAQSVPPRLDPGYLLTVSRLLPYKRVDAAIAGARLAGRRLVIVGSGPDRRRLQALSAGSAVFLETVSDDNLRWLYANASALVCAGFEDFGLAPLEAFQFGTPVLALRSGGYLETVRDGINGLFFDVSSPELIAAAIARAEATSWEREIIRQSAAHFSEAHFITGMRRIVAQAAESRAR